MRMSLSPVNLKSYEFSSIPVHLKTVVVNDLSRFKRMKGRRPANVPVGLKKCAHCRVEFKARPRHKQSEQRSGAAGEYGELSS